MEHEGMAEKKAKQYAEDKEMLAAYVVQIRQMVNVLTSGRVHDFDFGAIAKEAAIARRAVRLGAKDNDDKRKVAGRRRDAYMEILSKLFGQEVANDDILNLVAICKGNAPLADFAQLFRIDPKGTIVHTREFALEFAKKTQTHSECVARRIARELWELRKNAPPAARNARAELDALLVGGIEEEIRIAQVAFNEDALAFKDAKTQGLPDAKDKKRIADDARAVLDSLKDRLKTAKDAADAAQGKLRKLDRLDELAGWARAMRLYRIPCGPAMEDELRRRIIEVGGGKILEEPVPLWGAWQEHVSKLLSAREKGEREPIGTMAMIFSEDEDEDLGETEGAEERVFEDPLKQAPLGHAGKKLDPALLGAGRVFAGPRDKDPLKGRFDPALHGPVKHIKPNPPVMYTPNAAVFTLIPTPVALLFALRLG
jgi:hypothetical protein